MGQKVIFQTGLTDYRQNPTAYPEQLGTIRYENTNVYKYVAFSGTTTIAVGDVVCYVAAAGDGSEYIVDGANTSLAAGVALAAVASGSKATGALQYYTGWILVRGLVTLSTALAGSPSAGDALTTNGATAPAVTKATAANHQQCCFAYDVSGKKVTANFPF